MVQTLVFDVQPEGVDGEPVQTPYRTRLTDIEDSEAKTHHSTRTGPPSDNVADGEQYKIHPEGIEGEPEKNPPETYEKDIEDAKVYDTSPMTETLPPTIQTAEQSENLDDILSNEDPTEQHTTTTIPYHEQNGYGDRSPFIYRLETFAPDTYKDTWNDSDIRSISGVGWPEPVTSPGETYRNTITSDLYGRAKQLVQSKAENLNRVAGLKMNELPVDAKHFSVTEETLSGYDVTRTATPTASEEKEDRGRGQATLREEFRSLFSSGTYTPSSHQTRQDTPHTEPSTISSYAKKSGGLWNTSFFRKLRLFFPS